MSPRMAWGERVFLALALLAFATCADAQESAPDATAGKPTIAVWSPAPVRRTLDSLFSAFEAEPSATKVVCVPDFHAFPSETHPGITVVAVFGLSPAKGENCGKLSFLLFDLRCRGFTERDQVTINALQIPMVAFVCRRADGRLWFSLLFPTGPKA